MACRMLPILVIVVASGACGRGSGGGGGGVGGGGGGGSGGGGGGLQVTDVLRASGGVDGGSVERVFVLLAAAPAAMAVSL